MVELIEGATYILGPTEEYRAEYVRYQKDYVFGIDYHIFKPLTVKCKHKYTLNTYGQIEIIDLLIQSNPPKLFIPITNTITYGVKNDKCITGFIVGRSYRLPRTEPLLHFEIEFLGKYNNIYVFIPLSDDAKKHLMPFKDKEIKEANHPLIRKEHVGFDHIPIGSMELIEQ